MDDELQKFIDRHTNLESPVAPKSDFPVDIELDETAHPVFNDEVKYDPINLKPKPTSAETIAGAFRSGSEWYTAQRKLNDIGMPNPFDDVAPEGWKVTDDLSVISGIDPKYQGYILAANSPNDAKNRQFQMLQRQEDDNNWKDGTTFNQLLGGFGAMATNPTSWIPFARAAKYAKLTEGIVYNTGKVAPSIAASSIAHEGWQNALKQGGNMEDFVVDSFVDIAMGTAFMAGGYALGGGVDAMKLWNMRKLIKLNYDGIELHPELDEKGIVTGAKAVAAPGSNLSAAMVDHAQEYANAEFAKNGLFSVPFLGAMLNTASKSYNPLYRGLNSKSETVRGYANAMGSHGLATKGTEAGIPNPINFDDEMHKLNSDNIANTKQYEGFYNEHIGIDPSANQLSAAYQKIKAKLLKEGRDTPAQFGKKVRSVLETGNQDASAAVNEAANFQANEYKEMYEIWRESEGYEKDFLDPVTMERYVPRVGNHDEILTEPVKWNEMVLGEAKEQASLIQGYMKPIDEMRAASNQQKLLHQELIASNKATDEEIKESALKLESFRKKVKTMKENLQNELRSNKDLHIHLEDVLALSAKEANQLKKLLKPQRLIEKELKTKKSILEQKKHQAFLAQEQMNASKNKQTATKHKKSHDLLQKEVNQLDSEIKDLKDKHFLEEDALQEKAQLKQIPRILYERIPGSERVKFKDPKKRLKFVKPLLNDHEIISSAEATRNSYLNMTNEDVIHQVLGKLTGIQPPNPIKNRTFMIRDSVMSRNNFLSTDLALSLANYRKALGRQVILKKVFGDLSIDGDIKPIIERRKAEYDVNVDKIKKSQLSADAKKQALRDEKKDFDKDLEYMNLSFNRAMGRSPLSPSQRKFAHFTSTLSAATRLGFTLFTMTSDLMGAVFKQGFFPSIQHGLLPMLKTFGGHAKGKDAEHVREVAAGAYLANNHLITSHRDQNMSSATEQHIPIQGKLGTGLEWLANVSNNFNLISYAENFLQRWVATVIQHKIMKGALDFKAGKLKDRDHKAMLQYGLDIKKHADDFISGWRERGEDGNGFGGYQSRYWEWSNTSASNKFADTVMRGTRDTIIRRGIMDAPFFTDSSLWGSLFATFKGWTFASGTRYLIPLLQDPKDANKIVGTMLMLGMGATQSPLRKLASGQELTDDDLDPTTLFMNGIYNSGVFSIPAEAIQSLNILSSGKLLKGISNQKYYDRTIAGVAAGAPGGVMEDIRRMLVMVGTNNYNQNDVRKMVGLTGIGQSLWLRGLANKMVEATGLPKTYSEAEKANQ